MTAYGPPIAIPTVRRRPSRDQVWLDPSEHRSTDDEVWDEVWAENVYHVESRYFTGGVVIDAGANIGAFSLLALAAHPDERVVAIEPHPDNLAVLRANLDLNAMSGRCAIIAGALGEPDQRVVLDGAGAAARTVPAHHPGTGVITTVTLDEILAAQGDAVIDVLKLDIEGAEYDALACTSADALERVRFIVGEFHPGPIGALVTKLLDTHAVDVFGDPAEGGNFYAHRYDV